MNMRGILFSFLGGLYVDKNLTKSIEYYQKSLEIFRKKENSAMSEELIYNGMALAYNQTKHYIEASKIFEKLININPTNPDYYVMLTNIYSGNRDDTKAIEVFNHAIKNGIYSSDLFLKKAIRLALRKKYKEAEEAFNKAIELNPKNHFAWIQQGNFYRMYPNKKNNKKALNSFQEALKITSYDKYIKENNITDSKLAREFITNSFLSSKLMIYQNIGKIYKEEEKYEQAIEVFQKLIEINSKDKNPIAYVNLFELQLITNQKFNSLYEKDFLAYFSTKKSSLMEYEMLKVLKNIANSQKDGLSLWIKRYKNTKGLSTWDFKEIDKWVDKSSNEEVKRKLLSSLKVFKGHK